MIMIVHQHTNREPPQPHQQGALLADALGLVRLRSVRGALGSSRCVGNGARPLGDDEGDGLHWQRSHRPRAE